MNQHPIYLSDTTYRLLARRAAQENKPVGQVAERLLAQELALSADMNSEQGTEDEALTAVYRLTHLFADVELNHLEQVLDDPMLELANVDFDMP